MFFNYVSSKPQKYIAFLLFCHTCGAQVSAELPTGAPSSPSSPSPPPPERGYCRGQSSPCRNFFCCRGLWPKAHDPPESSLSCISSVAAAWWPKARDAPESSYCCTSSVVAAWGLKAEGPWKNIFAVFPRLPQIGGPRPRTPLSHRFAAFLRLPQRRALY